MIDPNWRRKAFGLMCGICKDRRRGIHVPVAGSSGYRLWRFCDKCDRV